MAAVSLSCMFTPCCFFKLRVHTTIVSSSCVFTPLLFLQATCSHCCCFFKLCVHITGVPHVHTVVSSSCVFTPLLFRAFTLLSVAILFSADVQKAILFAKQHGIRPTVSSSTHDYIGEFTQNTTQLKDNSWSKHAVLGSRLDNTVTPRSRKMF